MRRVLAVVTIIVSLVAVHVAEGRPTHGPAQVATSAVSGGVCPLSASRLL